MRISDWSSDVCSSDLNDGHAEYTVPGDALLSRDNLYIRNALIQNFTENRGKLFQAKGDVDYDLDGFLSNIAAGVRYAHPSAEEPAVNLNMATQSGRAPGRERGGQYV